MKKRVVKFKKETEEALIKAVSKKKLKDVKVYVIIGNNVEMFKHLTSLFKDSKDVTVLTKFRVLSGIDCSDGILFLYGVSNLSEAEFIQIRGRFNRIGSKYPNQILKVFIKVQ